MKKGEKAWVLIPSHLGWGNTQRTKDIKQFTHLNYNEILITGGEPLLFPKELWGFLSGIRPLTKAKINYSASKNV